MKDNQIHPLRKRGIIYRQIWSQKHVGETIIKIAARNK